MKRILAGLAALVSLASPAYADVTLIFGAGDPGSNVTGGTQATFSDIAQGSYASLAIPGVTLTAGTGTSFDISSDYDGQFNVQGRSLQGSFDADAFQSLTFTFDTAVQAFAFNYGGADTNWLLEAFDASGQSLGIVTLLSTSTSNTGAFYGLASDAQDIARAVLSVDEANYNAGTIRPDYVFLDNVTIGQFPVTPVPEPGEWAMIALGLGIVGAAARRRGRTAS